MKVAKLFLIIILSIGLVVILFFTKSSKAAEVGNSKKVIAVVLDNSTSMVRDDPAKSKKDYTTRWVEADYAVRALAAMMNAGDILKVYPLNGKGLITIKISTKSEKDSDKYKTLYSGLNNMKYYGRTPFQTVKKAAKDLRKEKNKECCLVIITDGNFKKSGGKGKDFNKKEMKEKFSEVLEISENFSIKCIPIGKNVNISVPANERISVYNDKSDTSKGVIYQITDVINEIYSRVAMNEKNMQDFVKKQKDTITITFDIPVNNVTVFFQSKKVKTNVWRSVKYNNHKKLETSPISFKGTKKKPIKLWASQERLKKSWIQNLSLSGMVFRYNFSGNTKKNSITFSNLLNINKKDIQIYYEPVVFEKITIQPENTKSFVYKKTKGIFTKGEVKLKIEYLDSHGNLLKNQKSSLLKTKRVEVIVDDRKFQVNKNKKGICTYVGTIKDSDENGSIIITNKIGLNGGKTKIAMKKLYEQDVKPIIKLKNKNSALLLDKNGKTQLDIIVLNKKINKPFTKKEWKQKMTLNVKSKYFKIDSNKCHYNSNGSISIPIFLKDINQHKISEDTFTICVKKEYSDNIRKFALAEKVSPLKITSKKHILDAKIEKENISIYSLLLGKKEISILYYCDEEELNDSQKKDMKIELVSKGEIPKELMSLEKDSSILLLQSLKWIFFRKEDCKINLKFFYDKWNHNMEKSIELMLHFTPINPFIVILFLIAIIVLVCVLIWKIIWVIKRSRNRGDYIPLDTTFSLSWDDNRITQIKLDWPWYSKILFYVSHSKTRYIFLKHISEGKENVVVPRKIILYISKEMDDVNQWTHQWIIRKINRIKPLSNLKIDGKEINKNNFIISSEKKLIMQEMKNQQNEYKFLINGKEP